MGPKPRHYEPFYCWDERGGRKDKKGRKGGAVTFFLLQEVSCIVENRRRDIIESVRVRRDDKRKVLKDQIEAIDDEKKKLEKVRLKKLFHNKSCRNS